MNACQLLTVASAFQYQLNGFLVRLGVYLVGSLIKATSLLKSVRNYVPRVLLKSLRNYSNLLA